MKKLILGLLAVTTIATADAQKNSILLYGNLGLNMENTDFGPTGPTNDWLAWNVNPGVGYQFSNHFTVGIQGSFGMRRSETTVLLPTRDSVYTSTWTDWKAGVFGRHTYYINDMFMIWNQVDVSYEGGSMKGESVAAITTSTEDTYTGFSAMYTPAFAMNVYKGLALNFSFGGIGFSTNQWDIAAVTNNKFNVTFGQQVNFGITKNFKCTPKRAPKDPGMEMRKMKKHQADEEDDE